jgi:BirA family biotin operon repressor/biotin-[acetyl-CoA-carboxylase] ligase
MKDPNHLVEALSDLSLGGIRYFKRIGSTSDEAVRWAADGAGDFSLVVAAEQTSGRGRAGRTWYSYPGASLAMSVILLPPEDASHILPRMSALGALAVRDALMNWYQLPVQIKWPNDILLQQRKVSGILAEAFWNGNEMAALILGIGVNIAANAVSHVNHELQNVFPATYLEAVLEQPVESVQLLRAILVELKKWRSQIDSAEFMQAWEDSLAYRGEWVQVISGQIAGGEEVSRYTEGRILGLSPDGSLKLHTLTGEVTSVQFGDVRLRPLQLI